MKIIQCIEEIKILESFLQIEKSTIIINKKTLINEIEKIIQSIIDKYLNITDPLELNTTLEDKFNIKLCLLNEFYQLQEEETKRETKRKILEKNREKKEQKKKKH